MPIPKTEAIFKVGDKVTLRSSPGKEFIIRELLYNKKGILKRWMYVESPGPSGDDYALVYVDGYTHTRDLTVLKKCRECGKNYVTTERGGTVCDDCKAINEGNKKTGYRLFRD